MSPQRSRLHARLRGTKVATLRMTSLMDIFTALLLFLLKAFVASGQSGTVSPGVQLPSSLARTPVREAPIVAVTRDFVLLDGEAMASSTEAVRGSNLEIAPLYARLSQLHGEHSREPGFEPRVVVQGDRGIEFRLLQRVMYTSHLAGYTSVSLAVLQDEAP